MNHSLSLKAKKIWIFSLSANKDKSSMLKMPILLHISRGDNTCHGKFSSLHPKINNLTMLFFLKKNSGIF